RVELQKKLQEKYLRPLLAVRANYPGEDKLEPLAIEISDMMAQEIERYFFSEILHKEIFESLEGKIYIYIIDSDIMNIKQKAVHIEESHLLGRCVDIDVYHKDGRGISRNELGYPKRKCLICDEVAFNCARSVAHPHSEIKREIFGRYKKYQEFLKNQETISKEYAVLSIKAMILEVSSFPAFGLVTPLTSGSHKDMDYFTFIESIFAIERYFQDMAKAGYSYIEIDEMFRRIRKIGMAAEEKMFAATRGINTHKGMVFLMGIAVAVAARTAYEGRDIETLVELVSHMCRDIMMDFEGLQSKVKLTHGEKLFLEHGITGVRGVVKDGLKIVFEKSLKTFTEGMDSGK
ncbi:MAG: citrate lyase holo-[acyl-carrier protein] synthase, partial [Cetobacterium sp.]